MYLPILFIFASVVNFPSEHCLEMEVVVWFFSVTWQGFTVFPLCADCVGHYRGAWSLWQVRARCLIPDSPSPVLWYTWECPDTAPTTQCSSWVSVSAEHRATLQSLPSVYTASCFRLIPLSFFLWTWFLWFLRNMFFWGNSPSSSCNSRS